MKRILTSAWITILCGLFPHNGWSTPTVTSAPSTVSHGQSITITGTGFGTKVPVKPYLWADFNSSLAPSSLGIKTAWSASDENITYQAGCGPDGSGCATDTCSGAGLAACNYNGDGPALMINTHGDWYINTLNQKSYLYKKTKKNFNIASYNMKTFRAWAPGGSYPNVYENQGNGSSDMEGGDVYCWSSSGNPPSIASNTNWVAEELTLKANSATSLKDGIFRTYHDGVLDRNCDGSYYSWQMRSASNDTNITEVLPFQAIIANTPNWTGSLHYWVDNIYFDNTWARVMICSGSTWANRGSCEIQIPSAWTSTSVTVTVNQGVLTGSKFLYVVDSEGAVNSTGQQITFGGISPVKMFRTIQVSP